MTYRCVFSPSLWSSMLPCTFSPPLFYGQLIFSDLMQTPNQFFEIYCSVWASFKDLVCFLVASGLNLPAMVYFLGLWGSSRLFWGNTAFIGCDFITSGVGSLKGVKPIRGFCFHGFSLFVSRVRFFDLVASTFLGFPSWRQLSWALIVIGVPAVIVSLGGLDFLRALILEPSFSPLWVCHGGEVRQYSDMGGFGLATLL